MRRSMKPSEGEKESKVPSTRRARSLLSIPDFTLRRSSRISKVMESNPPEASENSRVTRSRASTVDRELGTPSSSSKRNVRAGSETKTMTPGRVLRNKRTSVGSSEDTAKDDILSWKPYETSWSRKRLSMLPSEPSVAEEVPNSKHKDICVIEIDDDSFDQLPSPQKMPVKLDIDSLEDQVASNSTEAPTFADPINPTDTTTSDEKDESNGCDKKLTNIENEDSFTLPAKPSTFKPKRRSLMLLRKEKEMNKDGTYAEYRFSENEEKIEERMEGEDQNSLQFEDSAIIEPQRGHDLKGPLADNSVTIVEEVKTTVKNKDLTPQKLSVAIEKLQTDQWISSEKENTIPIESIASKGDFESNLCDSLKKSSIKITQDSGVCNSENDLSDLDTDFLDAKSNEKTNIQRLNPVVVLKKILNVTPDKLNLSNKAVKESETSEEKDDFVDGNEKEGESFPGDGSEISLVIQEIEETPLEMSGQETTEAVINAEENSETNKFEKESQKCSSPTVSPRKALESPEKVAESRMIIETSPARSESSMDTFIIERSGNSSEERKKLENSPSSNSICSLETIINEPPSLTQNSPPKNSPRQLNSKINKALNFDIENIRNNSESLATAEDSPESLSLQFDFEPENVSFSIKTEVLQSEIETNEHPLVEFPEVKKENLSPFSTLKKSPESLNLESELEKISEDEKENNTLGDASKLKEDVQKEDSDIEIVDDFLETVSEDSQKINPGKLSSDLEFKSENGRDDSFPIELQSEVEIKDRSLEPILEVSTEISGNLNLNVELKNNTSESEKEDSDEMNPLESENRSLNVSGRTSENSLPESPKSPRKSILKSGINENKIINYSDNSCNDMEEETSEKKLQKESPLKSILRSKTHTSEIFENSDYSDQKEDSSPKFSTKPLKSILKSGINESKIINYSDNSHNEMEEETSEKKLQKESPLKSILRSKIHTSETFEDLDDSDQKEDSSTEFSTKPLKSILKSDNSHNDMKEETSEKKLQKESPLKSILRSKIHTSEICEDSDYSDRKEDSSPELSTNPRNKINQSEIVEDSDHSYNEEEVSDIDEVPKSEEESLEENSLKLSEEEKESSVSPKKRRSQSLKVTRFGENDSSDEETEALENIAKIKALQEQEKESLRLKKKLADLILEKESEVLKLKEELTPKLNKSNGDSMMEVVDFKPPISDESESRESSIVAGSPSKQTDEKEEDLENLFEDITEEEFSCLRKNPSNFKGTKEYPVLLDEEVDFPLNGKKALDDSIFILDDLALDKSVEFVDEIQSVKKKDNMSSRSLSDLERWSAVKNPSFSKSVEVSPSTNLRKKSNAPVVRKIEILKNNIEIESLKQNLRQLQVKEKEKENKKNLIQTENSKFTLKQSPFKQTPESKKLFSAENIKKEKTQKGPCQAFFMNFSSSEDENSDFSIDTDAAMEYNLPGKRLGAFSSESEDLTDAEAEKCRLEKIEESKSALEEKEKSLRKKMKKNKEKEPEISADLEEKRDDCSMSKKKKKKGKKEEPEIVEIEGREEGSSKKKNRKNKEPEVIEMGEIKEERSKKKKKNKKNKEEPEVVEMEERKEERSKEKKKSKENKEEREVVEIKEREEESSKKKKKKNKRNKEVPEVVEIEERKEESSKKKNKVNKEEPTVDEDIVKEKKKKKRNQREEKEVEIEVKPVKEKKKKNQISEEIPKIEEDQVPKKKKDKKEMPDEVPQFNSVPSDRSDKKKRRREKTEVELELQVSEPEKKRSKKEKNMREGEMEIENRERRIKDQELKIKIQEKAIRSREKGIQNLADIVKEKKKKSKPEAKVENVGKKSIERLPQEILESLSDLPKENTYVPSLSMTDREIRVYTVKDESSKLSVSGSTSAFWVSKVAIGSSRQNRAKMIRNFRDNLLKRFKRV